MDSDEEEENDFDDDLDDQSVNGESINDAFLKSYMKVISEADDEEEDDTEEDLDDEGGEDKDFDDDLNDRDPEKEKESQTLKNCVISVEAHELKIYFIKGNSGPGTKIVGRKLFDPNYVERITGVFYLGIEVNGKQMINENAVDIGEINIYPERTKDMNPKPKVSLYQNLKNLWNKTVSGPAEDFGIVGVAAKEGVKKMWSNFEESFEVVQEEEVTFKIDDKVKYNKNFRDKNSVAARTSRKRDVRGDSKNESDTREMQVQNDLMDFFNEMIDDSGLPIEKLSINDFNTERRKKIRSTDLLYWKTEYSIV